MTTSLVGLRPGRALPPSTASSGARPRASGTPWLRPVHPVTQVSSGSPDDPTPSFPPTADARAISAVTAGTRTGEVD